MGLGKLFFGLFVILLLFVAWAHFSPKSYTNSKEKLLGPVKDTKVGGWFYSILDFGTHSCDTNQDCLDKYNLEGLTCSINHICEVAQNVSQ